MTTIRKLVIVGDAACGKVSILTAFCKDQSVYVPRVFENYATKIEVDGTTVELALWDTSGQEDFQKLRPLSYPDTDVILMCFSIDSPDSLENIQERWTPEVRHFCPNVPIVLVGNKKDLRNDEYVKKKLSKMKQEPVKSEEGSLVCERINAYAYMECSAKTREGGDCVFDMSNVRTPDFNKVVIVGDNACGKASLLNVFSKDELSAIVAPTIFENYVARRRENFGTVTELPSWDYGSVRVGDSVFFPFDDVFLMCFSIDSPDSLKNITEKWIPEVERFHSNARIILVGNKKDLRNDVGTKRELAKKKQKPVKYKDGVIIRKRINAYKYLECSAKTGKGVEKVFETAVKLALEYPANLFREMNRANRNCRIL
ncbi:hypothetical protein ACROYT_G032923 [Oculina patagonica]